MSWTDRIPAPTRRRLRVLSWRARRPAAALCAGIAVLLVVERVRPPDPPTVEVAVAARDLLAGSTLTDADVVWRLVPAGLVPAGLTSSGSASSGSVPSGSVSSGVASADPAGVAPGSVQHAGLIGRRLAVDVPAGLPVAPELLVDEDATPPPGTVVVPVRFADAGVAAVLRAGMRVDVVASGLLDGSAPERLAHGAVVLGGPESSSGSTGQGTAGGLLGGGAGGGADPGSGEDAPVLLAVSPEESVALGGASGSRALGAVIVG